MKATKLQMKNTQGFTLIEILVVIGIIAVLAAIVLIAINPARQFAQANNTQRTSNINAILNGIGQYMADNQGALPPDIEEGDIDTPGDWIAINDTDAEDFCEALVPDYMPALPVDPENGEPIDDCAAAFNTGYQMIQDEDTERISVQATQAQLGETIRVTR